MSHEFLSFFSGLEATVTHLGRSVDKLEVDLFGGSTRVLGVQGFTKSENSLLWSDNTTLDDEKSVLDAGSVTNSVDLLVDFSSVMVTVLTSTGDSVRDTSRMPRSDTSNLSQTFVGLTWETGSTPTSGDTLVTFTLGNTDDVDHFAFSEDRANWDWFFEKRTSIVNLSFHVSSVDLDFHDVPC